MPTFYIFETMIKNHYKYGMTDKPNPYNRIKQYSGLNKCNKLITMYSVVNGRCEEDEFKKFLNILNIHIFSGKEFFYYDKEINNLLKQFKFNDCELPDVENNNYKLIYKPNTFTSIRKAKKLVSKEELDFYIKLNKISIKNIHLCRNCERKSNKKCCICDNYDRKNRRQRVVLIDTYLMKIN